MRNALSTLAVVTVLLAVFFTAPAAHAAGPWTAWTAYRAGDQVLYSGQLYQALQAHTSQPGWEPPNTPALWRSISAGTATRTPTRLPTGTPTGLTPTRTPGPATATPTRAGGAACAAPWNAATAYVGGSLVSESGRNYRASWWSQNDRPSTSLSGAWTDLGPCGAGLTLTPTRTASATPSGPSRTPTPTPNGGGFPARVSAPYVDISTGFSVVNAANLTGHKYFTLTFILSQGGGCVPAWDGTRPMNENYYAPEINSLRGMGGEVIISFGGAGGAELGRACSTVESLQAAYQSVVTRYSLKWADFNIEGSDVADPVSIDRRNRAIRGLQLANPGLRVSYTLPVLQSGLLQNELNLLSNARSNGVRIDVVNVMAMNYGPWGVDMGQAAIDAAQNTRSQLNSLGIPAAIGITPMIGQNNTPGEIFYLDDADQLVEYARANPYVGWLAFWSLGRDSGACPGQAVARADCSGIAQAPYAFTERFRAFP